MQTIRIINPGEIMSELEEIDQRLLIFGGPYSNLAATAALQARAQQLDIDASRVICTGDVIAYCGEPSETLDLIRDWGIHVVMGNCEESLANGEADCGCGFEPDSECSVLLDSINEFVFASSDHATRQAQIRAAGVDVVIGGHSGIPFGQRLGNCYWLNSGVIGMPANDGGSHGWYLMLEPTEQGIEASWHKLDYEHAVSRESTIAAGMVAYGEALSTGLWPSIDILPEAEAQQSGRPLEPSVLLIEPASVVSTQKVC
jgi:predicted phosphodiesterase